MRTIHPGEFTVDDIDATPDDGMRYELVDGTLFVTPVPYPLHQHAVGELLYRLYPGCPDHLQLFVGPLEFRPTQKRSLQPDLLVVRREDVGPRYIQRPPQLLVEVLSDVTRSKDLVLKRALYAEAGVPVYWVFDPDVPQLTVLRLDGDKYVEQAVVSGSAAYEADLPYPVRIVPDEIIR